MKIQWVLALASLIALAVSSAFAIDWRYAKQSDLLVVTLQVQDVCDARLQGIWANITRLETIVDPTAKELANLEYWRKEYERVRKLCQGA